MKPIAARNPRFAVAALALLSGASFGVARSEGYLGGLKTAPALVVGTAPVHEIADTLRAAETVSELFERRGVSGVDWSALKRAVRNFDPSRLRAGLVFIFRQRHGEPEPHAVVVRVSHDSRLFLRKGAGGWSASVERIPWRVEEVNVEGTIRNSLYQAMDDAVRDDFLPQQARNELVWGLSEVYDWSVDFSRDLQTGDRFRVVAERLVSAEGEIRYGRVLAARLDLSGKPLYAFRFDNRDRTEFYDEQGRSLKREFLRAPVEFKRISSRFSRRRFHPILGTYRAHLGTDFAAAWGTPVRSVGNGTVTIASREGGYGNLVEIRHNGSVTSRYAHLSSFADGIHVGGHVVQGQYVGRVGASGLATSPHLHYELRISGKAVNPRRQLGTGSGEPVASARRDSFELAKRRLRGLLEPNAVEAGTRQT